MNFSAPQPKKHNGFKVDRDTIGIHEYHWGKFHKGIPLIIERFGYDRIFQYSVGCPVGGTPHKLPIYIKEALDNEGYEQPMGVLHRHGIAIMAIRKK